MIFQPVFNGSGYIAEFLVSSGSDRSHGNWENLIKRAILFFLSTRPFIPFSLNFGQGVPRLDGSTRKKYASSELWIEGTEIRGRLFSTEEPPRHFTYPTHLVNFQTTMISHLAPKANLFGDLIGYFGLLTQFGCEIGKINQRDFLKVSGFHFKAPRDFSNDLSFCRKLIQVLERTAYIGLPVLIRNADQPADVYWFRQNLYRFPHLQFQGSVFANPMSEECMEALLAVCGENWHEYCVSGRYQRPD